MIDTMCNLEEQVSEREHGRALYIVLLWPQTHPFFWDYSIICETCADQFRDRTDIHVYLYDLSTPVYQFHPGDAS